MVDKETNKDEKIRNQTTRREVLQKSGASIGGLSIIGSSFNAPKLAKNESTYIGDVNLVESVLIYKGIPNDAFRTHYYDGMIRYHVNEEDNALIFNSRARERDLNAVRQNRSVIATNQKFSPEQENQPGLKSSKSIAIEKGHRTSYSKGVCLENNYNLPEIRIESNKRGVAKVRTDRDHYEVPVGVEKQIELQEKPVDIRRKSEDLKEVEDPRVSGNTRLVRKQGDIETVSVTPILIVRNSGSLTVHQMP